jgi:hypothetical protein
MPLHPPGNYGERLLVYGGQSAGKTTAWMSIADLALKTKSDAHFHVIDNDNATARLITNPRGSYHHLTANTTIHRPQSIDDYEPITEQILNDAQDDDWIIPDMLSNVWEGMPDWWHQNVFGESSWDYWVSTRKMIVEAAEKNEGHERSFGGDSGVDWQYIGKVYRGWEKKITVNAPCHVFATSSEAEIQARYDKTGEQAAMYEIASRFAPKTEKGAVHRFHTILRFSRKVSGQGRNKTFTRKMTMVKDRDREEIWEEKAGPGMTIELGDPAKFGFDYLVKIADWGLGKV